MVELKNEFLTVDISETGAEIHSVKDTDGNEYMWTADPNVWGMHAPLVFPICGGLKDDKYFVHGKEYTLAKHGFARFMTFDVEKASKTEAVFLLTATDETRKQYPFEFELRVIYTLNGKTLSVKYDVTNKSDVDMYYGIGGHEGYLCEDGIENYDVVFEENETLKSQVLHGNLLADEFLPIIENTNVLPLKYDYFAVDALVFKNVKSNSVTLVHRNGTRKIKVDFAGFNCLMLWTKPGAPYICIEPWSSAPDDEASDYDFTKKFCITKLTPNETKTNLHTITFEK
mgnify:FL=1